IGAVLTFGGHYERPGVVHYGGPGSLHVGELDGRTSERLERVAALLSLAHPAEVTDHVVADLWSKVALGAFYFGTALIDADVLEILDRPDALAVLGRLVAEVARVAAAEGVELREVDGFDPSAFVREDGDAVARSWESQRRYWRALQARRTGVWRDLTVHRRPTELDQVVGPVLERAARHRLETPRRRRGVSAPATTRSRSSRDLHDPARAARHLRDGGFDALARLGHRHGGARARRERV